MALKILLADDSMIAQSTGKKILTEAGYEVITVSNGAAAMKKFPEVKPDIVLLDVYMPGYNGLEVCQKIKATAGFEEVPVLLTVSKLEPFRADEGKNAKADGMIVKPFEATDLIAAVSRFAERLSTTGAASPPNPLEAATPDVRGEFQDLDLSQGMAQNTEAAEPLSESSSSSSSGAPAAFAAAQVPVTMAGLEFAAMPVAQPGVEAVEPSWTESTDASAPRREPEPDLSGPQIESIIDPLVSGAAWSMSSVESATLLDLPELEVTTTDPALLSSFDTPERLPAIVAETAPENAPKHRAEAAGEELPEFAFFSAVLDSMDPGFEARLTAAMEAYDAASAIPEPRPESLSAAVETDLPVAAVPRPTPLETPLEQDLSLPEPAEHVGGRILGPLERKFGADSLEGSLPSQPPPETFAAPAPMRETAGEVGAPASPLDDTLLPLAPQITLNLPKSARPFEFVLEPDAVAEPSAETVATASEIADSPNVPIEAAVPEQEAAIVAALAEPSAEMVIAVPEDSVEQPDLHPIPQSGIKSGSQETAVVEDQGGPDLSIHGGNAVSTQPTVATACPKLVEGSGVATEPALSVSEGGPGAVLAGSTGPSTTLGQAVDAGSTDAGNEFAGANQISAEQIVDQVLQRIRLELIAEVKRLLDSTRG